MIFEPNRIKKVIIRSLFTICQNSFSPSEPLTSTVSVTLLVPEPFHTDTVTISYRYALFLIPTCGGEKEKEKEKTKQLDSGGKCSRTLRSVRKCFIYIFDIHVTSGEGSSTSVSLLSPVISGMFGSTRICLGFRIIISTQLIHHYYSKMKVIYCNGKNLI